MRSAQNEINADISIRLDSDAPFFLSLSLRLRLRLHVRDCKSDVQIFFASLRQMK